MEKITIVSLKDAMFANEALKKVSPGDSVDLNIECSRSSVARIQFAGTEGCPGGKIEADAIEAVKLGYARCVARKRFLTTLQESGLNFEFRSDALMVAGYPFDYQNAEDMDEVDDAIKATLDLMEDIGMPVNSDEGNAGGGSPAETDDRPTDNAAAFK